MKKTWMSKLLVAALILSLNGACQAQALKANTPIALAVIYSQRNNSSISPLYFDISLNGSNYPLLVEPATPNSRMICITTSGNPYQSEQIIIPESDAILIEQQRAD